VSGGIPILTNEVCDEAMHFSLALAQAFHGHSSFLKK
jgi:hypothetical protein